MHTVEFTTIRVLVALGLIGLNGCFVLAEYALVRVRASRLELLARRGNPRAVRVQGMLQNLDVYLSACQMGITMSSLGLGWVGEPAFAAIVQRHLQAYAIPYAPIIVHTVSFALAFGFLTYLHILFGELVPRSIALQKAEFLALWSALPLKLFASAFRPPVALLAGTSMRILRLLGLRTAAEAESSVSEDEMRIILGAATEEKAGIPLERLLLLENIFDFGSSKISDIMVQRDRIAYLSMGRTWQENLEVICSRRYSRYPLCELDLNTPIGMVHVKDIVLSGAVEPNLRAIKREIATVVPSEPLQKLLQSFADKGIQQALVREEGVTVGLVTLEDFLEEIVGEIHDEFDLPQAWSLMDVLVSQAVEVGLEAVEPEPVIRRLLDRLKESHPTLDYQAALKAVLERERKFSTALGHGIAIPHGRLPNLDRPLVAIARSQKSFHFAAPDKAPVRLVFLILTPAASPVIQLKILSRVASLVSNENLRRRLLRTKTSDHLVDILRTADTVLAT